MCVVIFTHKHKKSLEKQVSDCEKHTKFTRKHSDRQHSRRKIRCALRHRRCGRFHSFAIDKILDVEDVGVFYIDSKNSKIVTCYLGCIVLKNRLNFSSLRRNSLVNTILLSILMNFHEFHSKSHSISHNTHPRPHTHTSISSISRYTHTLHTRYKHSYKHTRRRIYSSVSSRK